MNNLFLDFLNISITASYIILAVILIRFIFPKIPRKFICILWAIAGIRLVLPFPFESIFSLIPSAETVPPDIVMSHSPTIQSGIPMVNNAVNPVISDYLAPDAAASVNPLQILTGVAWNVWIIGVAVLLVYGIVSCFRVRKTVSDAVLLNGNIWQSEKVVSPFILGVIKPKIYIPYGMDGDVRSYVIAHENAHLKRRDHWIKPLGFLLLSVYWFNPLIWIAYIMLCKDIERACDEKVISQMNEDNRKEYASALLECAVNRRRIAACPLAFGETGLKERVKGIMNYKKPAFWVMVIAVIACIVAAVCFLTNPKTPAEYIELGYRLNITEDTYSMTTQLPDKTEKKSYKVGEGTKGELSNGTKFEIIETNLQTGELTIKFSGEPLYSLVETETGNENKECGQLTLVENTSQKLTSEIKTPYREYTFEFVKTEDLENAISDAIIQTHRGGYKLGTYACEDHEIFATESVDTGDYETVNVYMWVNYGEFIKYGDSLVEISGSACPTVLTFDCVDGKYNLTEYWTAEDGTRYVDSIREKYPKNIVSEVLSYNYDSKSLDKKAEAYFYDNKKFYSATNYGNVSVDVASYNLKDFGKTTDGEYLKLEWQNHSGTDWFSYGNSFYMERFNPDMLGFEEFKPSGEMMFTTPELYVEPGQKREQWYDLGAYDFSQPGYYRFVTNFNFDEMDREGVAIVDFTVGDIALKEKSPEEYATQAVYTDNDFKALFSRVGYAQNGTEIISKFAEKAIYTPENRTEKIPVIRFDSRKELDSFIDAARKPFYLESDWEKGYSFLENTEEYTEEFFRKKSVVLVYLTEGSGSIRHKIHSLTKKDGIANVVINKIAPEVQTADEANWFITIAVDKAFLSDCRTVVASRGERVEETSVSSGAALDYISEICYVNYVENGEDVLMKYAEIPMYTPYSGEEYHSVAAFETLQGLNEFYDKTQNIFSYGFYNGYPSFDQARSMYNTEFFEDYNLLIFYVTEPGLGIRHKIISVSKHNNIHIEIRREVPEAYDTAMAGWFVTVGISKADMKDTDLVIARTAESVSVDYIKSDLKTEAGTVSYVMASGYAYAKPRLDLMPGNRFNFLISPLSSYLCKGKYRYDTDNLILETDDGLYTYVFEKDGDNLVFNEEKSSEIRKYKPSENANPVAPVRNADVFVKI